MTASLLDRIADLRTLQQAWHRTRESAGDRLESTREFRDFELRLEDNLTRIAESLLDPAWRPRPLRPVTFRLPGHEPRELSVPPLADRVAERAIVRVVTDEVDADLSPWSFAYRPGRGVGDALLQVAALREEGVRWVLRTDIDDCFPSIARSVALAATRARCPDDEVVTLFEKLLSRPVTARPGDSGLPQGAPSSPLLSNLVLDTFDRAMERAGTPAVRYADDLVAPLTSPEAEAPMRTTLTEALLDAGLTSRLHKSRVASFAEGFAFLGEEVGPVTPAASEAPAPPARRTLFVTVDGAYVSIRRGQYRVAKGNDLLLSVPTALVGQLVIAGAVGLSAGARSKLLYDGVPATFISRRGRYLGRLSGASDNRASLRRAQYHRLDDSAARLDIASVFVGAKLANCRALLRRRAGCGAAQLPAAIDRLQRLQSFARAACSVSELLGYEGSAAKIYFEASSRLVPPWTQFRGRHKRPPSDPVNSVLSYSYAILTGEADAALQLAGLDPAAGFLHTDGDRPSLALDLMEELRPLIVDTVTLELFSRRALTAEHFTNEAKLGVRLTEQGRRVVSAAIEERLLTRVLHPGSGIRVSYRHAIGLQGQRLARWIRSGEPYVPMRWR